MLEKLIFMSLPYFSPGLDLSEAISAEDGNIVDGMRVLATKLVWTAEQLFLLSDQIERTPGAMVQINIDDESIDIDCNDDDLILEMLTLGIIDYIDYDPESPLGDCDSCGKSIFDCGCYDKEFNDWDSWNDWFKGTPSHN
jgi:hypothetical protein